MKALIVHGAYGGPEENWFPWLKRELEKSGFEVAVPKFPTPKGQSLGNWMKVLGEFDEWFGEELVLVGHSIGPALILRKLEKLERPVKAAFLVAGFARQIGDERFDKLNGSFFERKFEWEKIKANCGHFEVFHSDNDPFVPLKFGEELAEGLGVNLTLVKGAGHFNRAAGYEKFPLLLERIRGEGNG